MKAIMTFCIVLLMMPVITKSQDQDMISKLVGNWEEINVKYQGKGHMVGGFGQCGKILFKKDQTLVWTMAKYEEYSGVLRGATTASFTADWTVSGDKIKLSEASKGSFMSILGSKIVIDMIGTQFTFKYGKNGFGETVLQVMMTDGAEHIYKKID